MKHYFELPYLSFQTYQRACFYIYKINVNCLLFPAGVFLATAVSEHTSTDVHRTLLVQVVSAPYYKISDFSNIFSVYQGAECRSCRNNSFYRRPRTTSPSVFHFQTCRRGLVSHIPFVYVLTINFAQKHTTKSRYFEFSNSI